MVTRLPRVVVAAPSTGQGKTTIATGLMAALRHGGREVSPHKVGPDYIDPGYHAVATGRPGRNLDPHLVGEDLVAPLLLHGARGADVAVIEGVMGLHDGRLGTGGSSSTAHVARLTRTPVVLVLDVSRMSRTAAAVALGMRDFDPGVGVAGVILNRAGSPRNDAEITAALDDIGLPVLGAVPRDADLETPSRHLGLVTAAERDDVAGLVELLGERVAEHVDLDAVLALAADAPDLDVEPWDPQTVVTAPVGAGAAGERPVVAVAGGRAFTFRYPEVDELLTAAGCAVTPFDPLRDRALPPGTRAIYLGGGFPEVHADELADNTELLADLHAAVAAGVPTVAECAGLLYLARTLDDHPMAGALPVTAAMATRLTLRYPEAFAPTDTLLTRAGEQVTGHEFHRTATDPVHGSVPAWQIDDAPTGFGGPSLHASYLHVHWAGHPRLAQRLADAAHAAPAASTASRSVAAESRAVDAEGPAGTVGPDGTPTDPVVRPLDHHGDAEVGPGLLDLAVNVYPGPRPTWLDAALAGSLEQVERYPDARASRTAVARRHGRDADEVLLCAGAAEAFTLLARLRPWRHPVIVHPQFTEPHAALLQAGHSVHTVLCRPEDDFALDPAEVPEQADLVVIGNPTNPTGVLHPREAIAALIRTGRVVVVDEAFMDVVPGETESLAEEPGGGLVVVRSLTKHWSIPGVRAGYLLAAPSLVAELGALQPSWPVSTPALAAIEACTDDRAVAEGRRRAEQLAGWRDELIHALSARGIRVLPSDASFVLAEVGAGRHAALRDVGVAVRRADTFPGLDDRWVRIAVRPPDVTRQLLAALDYLSPQDGDTR